MHENTPGAYAASAASPLGSHRAPSWSSRHPWLTALICAASVYMLAYIWRLSKVYVLHTRGPAAEMAYCRRQGWKTGIAAILLLAGICSAPFADPLTMNSWEYISGFALLLFAVAFPVAVIPVVRNAGRELAWRNTR